MTYAINSKLLASEKVILVIAEAVDQFKVWSLHSGNIYKRSVSHFVQSVKQDSTSLVKASSSALTSGQYYFDAQNLTLYVRMTDDSHPKTRAVSATYRFFYSNAPYRLPNDISTGAEVEFLPIVSSIGSLGQQLDDQNTGIVLESQSTLTLNNNDGYFDSIFDTLIWENQNIYFYSWFPSDAITEAQKIFEGVIESKDFSTTQVTFKVKDFVFRLKNQVNLPLFSAADGSVSPNMIGKPKRRIYGQVKQLDTVGLDKILGGISLAGTISISTGSKTLTGTGSSFLDQLTPGDEIFITVNNSVVKYGVESVDSDTQVTCTSASTINVVNLSAIFKPRLPWRKKNRVWHLAGHKIRTVTTTVTAANSQNVLTLASVADLYPDDEITVAGQTAVIRRIVDNKVIFKSNFLPIPSVGATLTKNPVQKVYLNDKELFINRDYSVANTTEAIITLTNTAEFNIVEPRSIGVNLVFTNGSRTITTTATIDLRTILQPRDWISKDSVTELAYYEILDVREQTITLRTAFTGTTQTTTGLRKNVMVADDDALVTANCLGLEDSTGTWIKNPAQAVRHLCLNDAAFGSVNETSFSKAIAECDFILSLPIPERMGDQRPLIKDIITKINESVFGSLYGNSAWQICYSILNSEKPSSLQSLKDDDVLSFDIVSDQKIINAVKVNYRPYIDIYSGGSSFETYTKESDFVNRLIGIKNTEERTIYLYEDDKAAIIAQRILFFRSMSTCKVQVKSKLNLALTSVNDKMFIEFDRLYKRYGGKDRRKVGVVTAVKKTGLDTEIEFTDLGNIFNRVPSIAPNTVTSYATSSRDDVVRWGFVLDNDTLTPDVSSELEFGNNLIG